MIKWTRKRNNITSKSDNFVFRSGGSKNEQGLSVKQTNNAASDKSIYTTSNFRDDMSKDKQGLKEIPVRKLLSVDLIWRHFLSVVGRILLAARHNVGIKFEYAISRFDVITAIQIVWTILLKYFLRPVYTGDFCCDVSGDFCCDFVAISNRPCKLLAIPRRFESPVVYTPRNHAWNRSKNRQSKRAFMISVLTLGLIFIEEIKPCQFEIRNSSVPSSVVLKIIQDTGDLNLPLVFWTPGRGNICEIRISRNLDYTCVKLLVPVKFVVFFRIKHCQRERVGEFRVRKNLREPSNRGSQSALSYVSSPIRWKFYD